jgi:1,5-anhydro-D-fructose reductase (1,5-anhydro-D-mannitol-forming)
MTQVPKGEVLLRTRDGERQLSVAHENLYLRAVRLFGDAVAGRGAPSATGEDGIKSLSVALSTHEAARTGRETPIDLTT